MTKKRYNFTLDQEVVELLQAWLKPKGITLSGYVNSLLNENVEAVKILENVDDLKDISIGQLTKLYAGMVDGFKSESKEKEKKKK